MYAGFKAGTGNGHGLINETEEDVVYLEIGDRTPGDEGSDPDDDLKALMLDRNWKFVHKDGSPYRGWTWSTVRPYSAKQPNQIELHD